MAEKRTKDERILELSQRIILEQERTEEAQRERDRLAHLLNKQSRTKKKSRNGG